MTQAAPQKKSQFSPVIIIIILLGISIGVGFATMVMMAVLFLVAVGGPEWGPTLMLFGSPVVGFLIGVGSFVVMGGYSWWWRRGKRPFSLAYFVIWVFSWLVGLAILAFPFIYSLIADGYHWPEESLGFTIPFSLFVGLMLGGGLNWFTSKQRV